MRFSGSTTRRRVDRGSDSLPCRAIAGIGVWVQPKAQAGVEHDRHERLSDAYQAARWNGADLADCSTRSRISLPGWKCGTYFAVTATVSPLFGLRPVRA